MEPGALIELVCAGAETVMNDPSAAISAALGICVAFCCFGVAEREVVVQRGWRGKAGGVVLQRGLVLGWRWAPKRQERHKSEKGRTGVVFACPGLPQSPQVSLADLQPPKREEESCFSGWSDASAETRIETEMGNNLRADKITSLMRGKVLMVVLTGMKPFFAPSTHSTTIPFWLTILRPPSVSLPVLYEGSSQLP